ncbi:dihydroxyacetone kinase subunit DhaL [Pediococcus pentosaceus]|uniref:dihydroxyacetone kinase subunit DhaL n=1 Tax=Pediococcus pentosaceus TaxID=1255 RepID=UPI0023B1241B|nr:dihydroxyacetone kinase subunit DhaL [Pediococcus pentosaceus]MDE7511836.1 dihydroxyacetone kinase subunit L [Pediococcus pentosaceus]
MLDVENVKSWMTKFNEQIQAHHDHLSELDTPIGDGDHGNNMARGMNAVMEAIADKDFTDVPAIFKTIAMSLISKVGGASGPLYGTAFMEMAKVGDGEVSALLPAALAGIKKRGKAETGEKTMVDVWAPIAEKTDFTADDVDKAVEATKDMIATKGRASYVGERSVGHIDPGAMSSGYLLKALLEVEE